MLNLNLDLLKHVLYTIIFIIDIMSKSLEELTIKRKNDLFYMRN
jgi:hypothetical protein